LTNPVEIRERITVKVLQLDFVIGNRDGKNLTDHDLERIHGELIELVEARCCVLAGSIKLIDEEDIDRSFDET